MYYYTEISYTKTKNGGPMKPITQLYILFYLGITAINVHLPVQAMLQKPIPLRSGQATIE